MAARGGESYDALVKDLEECCEVDWEFWWADFCKRGAEALWNIDMLWIFRDIYWCLRQFYEILKYIIMGNWWPVGLDDSTRRWWKDNIRDRSMIVFSTLSTKMGDTLTRMVYSLQYIQKPTWIDNLGGLWLCFLGTQFLDTTDTSEMLGASSSCFT